MAAEAQRLDLCGLSRRRHAIDATSTLELTRAVLARARIRRHRWQTDSTRRCSLCFSTASTFASPSSGRRSNGRISADAVAAIIWPRATASSWLGTVAAVAAVARVASSLRASDAAGCGGITSTQSSSGTWSDIESVKVLVQVPCSTQS